MATKIWRGDAPLVAEVKTVTPANVEVDDIFTLTMNGKAISFTATANTVANVTAGLTTLWNASEIAEFAEVTAADANTAVTLTADNAGVPFTVTGSTTNVGGGANTQTLTVNTTTAASGPNCLIAANFGGSLPANTDTVIFEYGSVDLLYNLDALSAITLANLTVKQSFTGAIGLPRTNDQSGYIEYRPTSLQTAATVIDLGFGEGNGSGRVKLNLGNTNSTITVHNAGSPLENYIPSILLINTGATTVLNIYKGDVGVAFFAGETSTVATLNIGYVDNQPSDANVELGSGVTITTIKQSGGSLVAASSITTLNQYSGTATLVGAAAISSAAAIFGTLIDQSTGTIGNLDIYGTYDHSKSLAAKTIVYTTIYRKATYLDPYGVVATSTGFHFGTDCTLVDVTLSLLPGKQLVPA